MSGAARRGFLLGGAGVALGAVSGGAAQADPTPPVDHGAHAAHGGGINGPTFRGGQVDHLANGFNPTEILRGFDHGKTSKLPDGRTLREWEISAIDREIEVAPGVWFPSWTFNGRVPGPTLHCKAGDRLRVRFINGSEHPHTMHFHGIHPAEMDGVPGIGRGVIEPGGEFVYEFDAEPFGFISTTVTWVRWLSTSRAACTACSSSTHRSPGRRRTSW
ncbi:multicopper oxidase domain-containing protein [Kribbella catacumbae]|uniref:multicopper oxidase domain-containing protein n=1 Tax=Kribbella catacumbae TaxID=460086 RepID=UPI0003A3B227|nr:multicopper oxidase domain-containing protein [Kribbella catacumbae]